VTAVLLAAFLGAAPPEILNARVSTRSAAGGLAAAVQSALGATAGPHWIAWTVPLEGRHRMCCGDGAWSDRGACCAGCRLEGDRGFSVGRDTTTRLEADATALVLVRGVERRPERIRVFSGGCLVDAGGLPVTWLADVAPAQSVGLLETYAGGGDVDRRAKLAEGALAAIAFHAHPSADDALDGLTRPDRPERLRKQAAFWLGNARGRRGYEVLARMMREEPSPDVRAHVTFALSQSAVPEALAEMLRAARQDESGHVRGQALFWLAQKAGEKAAGAITRAIDDDPDAEVKEKAVFALSQLPRDQGVPRLIEVARSNRSREVRRKAMFWLGQSGDPRALAFIEDVLRN
jgi:hypothetical protein